MAELAESNLTTITRPPTKGDRHDPTHKPKTKWGGEMLALLSEMPVLFLFPVTQLAWELSATMETEKPFLCISLCGRYRLEGGEERDWEVWGKKRIGEEMDFH